ncbi:MAG TPA: hypothetical protein VH969_17470 [Actinophytocola sp.]|jgi:hypothetical protein|uniref:hypothetical protein n=1 Tax=Actinophytocola sp. TaxID=1872138 RepID=UPI002F92D396
MSNDRPAQVQQEDLLDRADVIDGGVRAVLAHLDLSRTDADHERTIDALMAVSRAADALRALARNDFPAADEATKSMARYADRARD